MLFQFLPRLSDDEYTALEKSIREHGVQVPITVDENRSVIDGHHRKEIADRLGIECPRRFAMDLTDEQKRTLALSLNLDRRHLSREQKQQLVRGSIKADPHLSDRQHAERTGVSPSTVGFHRGQLEAAGDVSNLDTRTDSVGRQQPARAEPTVNTETGEVSDDYLSDDATGEEVTPSTETEATTGSAAGAVDDVEEAPGEEVEPRSPEAPSRPDVTGIDGKTYPAREPKPRRKPLTDQAKNAGWDLRKSVERLQRIAADDRFNPQKEAMAPHLRGHLTNAIEVCQDLLDRINEQEESTK